jgi:hypothetical protein
MDSRKSCNAQLNFWCPLQVGHVRGPLDDHQRGVLDALVHELRMAWARPRNAAPRGEVPRMMPSTRSATAGRAWMLRRPNMLGQHLVRVAVQSARLKGAVGPSEEMTFPLGQLVAPGFGS